MLFGNPFQRTRFAAGMAGLAVLFMLPLQAANLTSTLSKTTIPTNGTVQLKIHYNDQIKNQAPELSASLPAPLKIIGSPKVDLHTSINGGITVVSNTWTLLIQATQPGRYIIPPFTLDGIQSEDITLTVTDDIALNDTQLPKGSNAVMLSKNTSNSVSIGQNDASSSSQAISGGQAQTSRSREHTRRDAERENAKMRREELRREQRAAQEAKHALRIAEYQQKRALRAKELEQQEAERAAAREERKAQRKKETAMRKAERENQQAQRQVERLQKQAERAKERAKEEAERARQRALMAQQSHTMSGLSSPSSNAVSPMSPNGASWGSHWGASGATARVGTPSAPPQFLFPNAMRPSVATNAQAPSLIALIDKTSTSTGEELLFTVTFNDQVLDDTPLPISKLNPGIEVVSGPELNTVADQVNGQWQTRNTWTWKLRAIEPGQYSLPVFSMAGVQTRSVGLVAEGATIKRSTPLSKKDASDFFYPTPESRNLARGKKP